MIIEPPLQTVSNREKQSTDLSSNSQIQEHTLQVALDALKLTPFYNAFEISTDVPEIYMQEFWVTVSRHHSSLRFKLNGKSHTVNVDNFRDMLKICPKLPGQKFEEPPHEETYYLLLETFGHTLGHWGIERARTLAKDQAIPRRNKMFWHHARDNFMFTTIRVISKHQDTQVYGAIIPRNLTNQAMLESEAYITYRAYAIEEVNKEDSFDPRVQTPSHVESTNGESNEESDKEVQGTNTEEEKMVEEATHEEDEANELYRDVNVNLKGRDTVMMDAPLFNVQATQETEDTHVILTAPINPEGQQQSSYVSSGFVSNMLNPRPDTGIDSIFNIEATSLVDVSVKTIVESPLVSATTLPPTPTPLITHMQQTPFPIPTIAPSTSLQDLPNFGSLFGFDHRLKTLETNFFEFNQTNQFAEAVSSILGIVDAYLANKMNDVIKTAVQLQSDRLRDEAQSKNEDFLSKLDDNIKKIIKEQVKEQVKAQVSKILPKIEKTVNEQLEAEIMTRSSTESKTSLIIAANLSELELKKILIEKMESNKSINRSNEQKNLYKALVKAYESDKLILHTYGDTVSFKRRKDDEDKDEEPSAGSNWGSKRRRAGKEPESTSVPKEKTSKTAGKSIDGSKSQHKSAGKSAHTEEPMHIDKDLEEPAHQEFDIGATEEQTDEETSQHPDWFQKPAKLPTPDRDWNKTLPAVYGPV
ncbi:hypothetical protein Tco_0817770 [Tanacetum coccineum]